MNTEGTAKSKEPEDEKAKENAIANDLEAEMEVRDEGRLAAERSERQNLTQGMDTGTSDSIHRGVDWRPEFSVHTKPEPPADPKDPKDKSE